MTDGLRCTRIALGSLQVLHMRHMLLVRSAPRLQAHGLQLVEQGLHFLRRPDGLGEALDIGHKAIALGHLRRHLGLEFAIAHKGNDRMHMLGPNAQQVLQRLGVLVVLAQRVLKLAAFLKNLLRPLTLLFRAKNPALVVLGLQHKNAMGRKNQMVNLRAATTHCGQGDVVQVHIDQWVQTLRNQPLHRPLSPPALEARRAQNAHQHHENQRQPQIQKQALKGH